MADEAFLDIVDYDEEVKPGGAMKITVKVWNTYLYVDPFDDPNHCITLDAGSGLQTYIEIVDNTTGNVLVTTDTFCMVTGGSRTYDITFTAPESGGEHVLYANAYYGSTKEIFGSQFRRVNITEDAPFTGSCLDNSGCPEGQICVDGTCQEGSEDGSVGQWVIQHPIETALGTVGFAIVVDQLMGD